MLDLSTCAALKAAGMPWEPNEGDWFYVTYTGKQEVVKHIYKDGIMSCDNSFVSWKYCLFCPRLDDLLAGIEGEGYKWDLINYSLEALGPYSLTLWINNGLPNEYFNEYFGDSPAQAAAAAYLWILQTKNKEG